MSLSPRIMQFYTNNIAQYSCEEMKSIWLNLFYWILSVVNITFGLIICCEKFPIFENIFLLLKNFIVYFAQLSLAGLREEDVECCWEGVKNVCLYLSLKVVFMRAPEDMSYHGYISCQGPFIKCCLICYTRF